MKKLLIMFFAVSVFAQQNENNLTGILSSDAKIAILKPIDSNTSVPAENPEKKSVILAGALSFAVPGAGEFYSENYLNAAIFFAVEVVAISGAIIYDKKGDDQTVVFQDFADGHWNVQKYAEWTKNKFSAILVNPDIYNFSNGVNWSDLNKLEEEVGRTESGKYYSHKLAPRGDQQYYEMIGKYRQFNVGWDDFNSVDYNHLTDGVTKNFDDYSNMRGKANDYYNIASTAVIIVVANHILSAADAMWSASQYNKAISATVSLEKTSHGFVTDIHPELNLKIRL